MSSVPLNKRFEGTTTQHLYLWIEDIDHAMSSIGRELFGREHDEDTEKSMMDDLSDLQAWKEEIELEIKRRRV